MLTEALRSFVMRVAWEHDRRIHSPNAGLAMNFSTGAVQEVSELYMDSAAARAARWMRMPTSSRAIPSSGATRGDTVQRLKVAGAASRIGQRCYRV